MEFISFWFGNKVNIIGWMCHYYVDPLKNGYFGSICMMSAKQGSILCHFFLYLFSKALEWPSCSDYYFKPILNQIGMTRFGLFYTYTFKVFRKISDIILITHDRSFQMASILFLNDV